MTAVDGPPEVDAQCPAPIVQGDIADGCAAGADASVVDHQGGRFPEPRLRLLGQLTNVVEMGHIAADREGFSSLSSDRIDCLLGGCFIDVAADHCTAAAGEFDHERRTDPAACPGYHRRGPMARLVRLAPQPEHLYPALSASASIDERACARAEPRSTGRRSVGHAIQSIQSIPNDDISQLQRRPVARCGLPVRGH